MPSCASTSTTCWTTRAGSQRTSRRSAPTSAPSCTTSGMRERAATARAGVGCIRRRSRPAVVPGRARPCRPIAGPSTACTASCCDAGTDFGPAPAPFRARTSTSTRCATRGPPSPRGGVPVRGCTSSRRGCGGTSPPWCCSTSPCRRTPGWRTGGSWMWRGTPCWCWERSSTGWGRRSRCSRSPATPATRCAVGRCVGGASRGRSVEDACRYSRPKATRASDPHCATRTHAWRPGRRPAGTSSS